MEPDLPSHIRNDPRLKKSFFKRDPKTSDIDSATTSESSADFHTCYKTKACDIINDIKSASNTNDDATNTVDNGNKSDDSSSFDPCNSTENNRNRNEERDINIPTTSNQTSDDDMNDHTKCNSQDNCAKYTVIDTSAVKLNTEVLQRVVKQLKLVPGRQCNGQRQEDNMYQQQDQQRQQAVARNDSVLYSDNNTQHQVPPQCALEPAQHQSQFITQQQQQQQTNFQMPSQIVAQDQNQTQYWSSQQIPYGQHPGNYSVPQESAGPHFQFTTNRISNVQGHAHNPTDPEWNLNQPPYLTDCRPMPHLHQPHSSQHAPRAENQLTPQQILQLRNQLQILIGHIGNIQKKSMEEARPKYFHYPNPGQPSTSMQHATQPPHTAFTEEQSNIQTELMKFLFGRKIEDSQNTIKPSKKAVNAKKQQKRWQGVKQWNQHGTMPYGQASKQKRSHSEDAYLQKDYGKGHWGNNSKHCGKHVHGKHGKIHRLSSEKEADYGDERHASKEHYYRKHDPTMDKPREKDRVHNKSKGNHTERNKHQKPNCHSEGHHAKRRSAEHDTVVTDEVPDKETKMVASQPAKNGDSNSTTVNNRNAKASKSTTSVWIRPFKPRTYPHHQYQAYRRPHYTPNNYNRFAPYNYYQRPYRNVYTNDRFTFTNRPTQFDNVSNSDSDESSGNIDTSTTRKKKTLHATATRKVHESKMHKNGDNSKSIKKRKHNKKKNNVKIKKVCQATNTDNTSKDNVKDLSGSKIILHDMQSGGDDAWKDSEEVSLPAVTLNDNNTEKTQTAKSNESIDDIISSTSLTCSLCPGSHFESTYLLEEHVNVLHKISSQIDGVQAVRFPNSLQITSTLCDDSNENQENYRETQTGVGNIEVKRDYFLENTLPGVTHLENNNINFKDITSNTALEDAPYEAVKSSNNAQNLCGNFAIIIKQEPTDCLQTEPCSEETELSSKEVTGQRVLTTTNETLHHHKDVESDGTILQEQHTQIVPTQINEYTNSNHEAIQENKQPKQSELTNVAINEIERTKQCTILLDRVGVPTTYVGTTNENILNKQQMDVDDEDTPLLAYYNTRKKLTSKRQASQENSHTSLNAEPKYYESRPKPKNILHKIHKAKEHLKLVKQHAAVASSSAPSVSVNVADKPAGDVPSVDETKRSSQAYSTDDAYLRRQQQYQDVIDEVVRRMSSTSNNGNSNSIETEHKQSVETEYVQNSSMAISELNAMPNNATNSHKTNDGMLKSDKTIAQHRHIQNSYKAVSENIGNVKDSCTFNPTATKSQPNISGQATSTMLLNVDSMHDGTGAVDTPRVNMALASTIDTSASIRCHQTHLEILNDHPDDSMKMKDKILQDKGLTYESSSARYETSCNDRADAKLWLSTMRGNATELQNSSKRARAYKCMRAYKKGKRKRVFTPVRKRNQMYRKRRMLKDDVANKNKSSMNMVENVESHAEDGAMIDSDCTDPYTDNYGYNTYDAVSDPPENNKMHTTEPDPIEISAIVREQVTAHPAAMELDKLDILAHVCSNELQDFGDELLNSNSLVTNEETDHPPPDLSPANILPLDTSQETGNTWQVYLCAICGKSKRSLAKLQIHYATKHQSVIFTKLCHQCGEAFASDEGLAVHMEMAHPVTDDEELQGTHSAQLLSEDCSKLLAPNTEDEITTQLEICEQNSAENHDSPSINSIALHSIRDSNISTPPETTAANTASPANVAYQCNTCHEKFLFPNPLINHIFMLHPDNRKQAEDLIHNPDRSLHYLECQVCSQIYDHPVRLENHMRLKHPHLIPKPFEMVTTTSSHADVGSTISTLAPHTQTTSYTPHTASIACSPPFIANPDSQVASINNLKPLNMPNALVTADSLTLSSYLSKLSSHVALSMPSSTAVINTASKPVPTARINTVTGSTYHYTNYTPVAAGPLQSTRTLNEHPSSPVRAMPTTNLRTGHGIPSPMYEQRNRVPISPHEHMQPGNMAFPGVAVNNAIKQNAFGEQQTTSMSSKVNGILNSSSYQCSQCDLTLSSYLELEHHELMHKEPLYKCIRCEEAFPTLHALLRHRYNDDCHRPTQQHGANQSTQ